MTNLWLDDMRKCPSDWVHAKSVNAAIEIMKTGDVTFASLDHDLGIWTSEGGSGGKLTDWMAENDIWPTKGLRVHSSNPVGVQSMLQTVDRYSELPSAGHNFRGEVPVDGWPSTERYV